MASIMGGMGIRHSTAKSFGFAFAGIKTALKEEPNFRIHLVLALFVCLLAFFLRFSSFEWIILIFTIFLVLILELINTSLEAITDIVSPEVLDKAKVAKDVSAAAVLLSAILAVIVAIFLFLPKLMLLF